MHAALEAIRKKLEGDGYDKSSVEPRLEQFLPEEWKGPAAVTPQTCTAAQALALAAAADEYQRARVKWIIAPPGHQHELFVDELMLAFEAAYRERRGYIDPIPVPAEFFRGMRYVVEQLDRDVGLRREYQIELLEKISLDAC